MASNDVLFALEEVTIHTTQAPVQKNAFGQDYWDVQSRTLLPGQSVPVSELPDYVKEAVEAGKVAGVSVMSESKAQELAEKAEMLRGLAVASAPAAHQYADGWDNSHSDHLVEDAVRAANLALQAEDAEVVGEGDDRLSGVGPDGETASNLGVTVTSAGSADTGDNLAEKQLAAGSGGEESKKQSSAEGDSKKANK